MPSANPPRLGFRAGTDNWRWPLARRLPRPGTDRTVCGSALGPSVEPLSGQFWVADSGNGGALEMAAFATLERRVFGSVEWRSRRVSADRPVGWASVPAEEGGGLFRRLDSR
jgi:hypothetical protein